MKRLFLIPALLINLTVSSYAATASPEATYSVESPLVAETLADVAYRLTDAAGAPVKEAKGQLVDEKGNVAATFVTDENGMGLFFFVPQICRYAVQWSVGDKEFMTDFLPVKKEGYTWSVDNTSNATYIPFDAEHPYWNPVQNSAYSDLELEQLSKLEHRIIRYSEKADMTPDKDRHVLKMSGAVSPVSWDYVKVFYSANLKNDNIIQGKDKPTLTALEYSRPQDVAENIRVWVERPKSMTGSTLRVAIYRGDSRQDEDVVDLSTSTLRCLSFPLRNIAQGDIEVRLYDNEGHLLATRSAKAVRYMHRKKYADVRKTDLDLRLGQGISYPLIASADWEKPEDSGLRMCFAPEGRALIAGVRGQIAFSAMNDRGEEVDVDGEIYSSKDSLQTGFASWSSRGGSFFMTPEKGESYYAKVNYNGKKYKVTLPEVESEGWMLGVDCLTQLASNGNSEEDVDEALDRLNYWGAFWEDGETYTRDNIGLKGEMNRMLAAQAHQHAFWNNQILKSSTGENRLIGKYAPTEYAIEPTAGGINIDYPNRSNVEDDIKIRLVNNNADNDSLEVLLTDDNGTVCDSQKVVMQAPEAWLRFPIDDSTPEGNLNIVITNPKGEKLCSRRFHIAHYSRNRDYRMARERDIMNILGARRYTPATAILK